jgi:hypothetical protein
MNAPFWLGPRVSTACLWVGVEPRAGRGWGGGGTLLGFEESHSSCLLLRLAVCDRLVGLVGWVVDSWIVDASILCTPPAMPVVARWSSLHQVMGGGGVRSL